MAPPRDPSPQEQLTLRMIHTVEENSLMLTRIIERMQFFQETQKDQGARLAALEEGLYSGRDAVHIRLVQLEERQTRQSAWKDWVANTLTTLLVVAIVGVVGYWWSHTMRVEAPPAVSVPAGPQRQGR